MPLGPCKTLSALGVTDGGVNPLVGFSVLAITIGVSMLVFIDHFETVVGGFLRTS